MVAFKIGRHELWRECVNGRPSSRTRDEHADGPRGDETLYGTQQIRIAPAACPIATLPPPTSTRCRVARRAGRPIRCGTHAVAGMGRARVAYRRQEVLDDNQRLLTEIGFRVLMQTNCTCRVFSFQPRMYCSITRQTTAHHVAHHKQLESRLVAVVA
jgi:hypothetical protein